MKRCPECRRDYYDDTLLYCLDDAVGVMYGTMLMIAFSVVTFASGFGAIHGIVAGTKLPNLILGQATS